jgi:cyanophycin synthetase
MDRSERGAESWAAIVIVGAESEASRGVLMEFWKIQALRGPNIWANSPVLEAWVDLKELKDTSSAMVPGFTDRLMAWLPGLIEHECSEGHRGGFLVRLREGTYPAHILEHVALELQGLAGTPVGYGRARETAQEGVYRVVIKYKEEAVGRACLETGRALVLAAMEDRPFDVPAEVRRLRALVHEVGLGPSTAAMLEAARARLIPSRRIGSNSAVVLGYGARQKRIYGSLTDRIGCVSNAISCDKELTKMLLRAVGVPVPEGRIAADADDAWQAAEELGVPVVVKPLNGDYGWGVRLTLTTREQVTFAYERAREVSVDVLVERCAPGSGYRLLVVGDRFVAATRRDPAQVVGDGTATVKQLVERANGDPRRGEDHTAPLQKIVIEEDALDVLASQGYDPDSVAPAGAVVLIQRKGHLTTGGINVDVTDQVHPDVAAAAVRAARAVEVEVAGVDVVAVDIGRPLDEQGGVVVEVNAGPGLRPHVAPTEGTPRPVAEAIIETLFPPGEDGRIPLVAVTGVNGKTITTRLIAHLLQSQTGTAGGLRVGTACSDGIFVGPRRIAGGDCTGLLGARDVLINPEIDAAVLEAGGAGILREGLGFDRCAVAVVTNIGAGDHLGHDNVMAAEDLFKVKRTIVDVVLPTGWAVLNAADPLVATMGEYCRGGVISFAADGGHPVIQRHRGEGKRVAFVQDGAIVFAEGENQEPVAVAALAQIALTRGGRLGFQVENVLAAAAAGWALGLPVAIIGAGLESFEGGPDVLPGRFNVFDAGGATVIVDSARNPSALEALVAALEGFPGRRRTIVLSADGDRLDEVIVRQGEILGSWFDRVVLYEEPARRRGRAAGAILELLGRGLDAGAQGRTGTPTPTPERIEVCGEEAAIARGLSGLESGDVVVILAASAAAPLGQVQRLLAERNGDRGI